MILEDPLNPPKGDFIWCVSKCISNLINYILNIAECFVI
jgi:hypothetical protein